MVKVCCLRYLQRIGKKWNVRQFLKAGNIRTSCDVKSWVLRQWALADLWKACNAQVSYLGKAIPVKKTQSIWVPFVHCSSSAIIRNLWQISQSQLTQFSALDVARVLDISNFTNFALFVCLNYLQISKATDSEHLMTFEMLQWLFPPWQESTNSNICFALIATTSQNSDNTCLHND